MKISKPKWLEKRARKKRDAEWKKLHRTAEPSCQIIHRLPTIGDTTVTYAYEDILDLYNEADRYTARKIEEGIQVDEKTGKFLKEDLEVRCLIQKVLLLEQRECHRNARISINEEKRAYKEQLELERKELQTTYEELCKECDKDEE